MRGCVRACTPCHHAHSQGLSSQLILCVAARVGGWCVRAENPEEIDLDMDMEAGRADGDAAGGAGAGGAGAGDDEDGADLQQRAVPAAVFGSLAAAAEQEKQQQGAEKAMGALERLRRAKQQQ